MVLTIGVENALPESTTAVQRKDLFESGLTRRAIERQLRSGSLERVRWGVYATSQTDDAWLRRVSGAVVGAGPAACAGLRTAARLHGLDGFDSSPDVDVMMPYGHRSAHGARRSRSLEVDHVTVVAGIPCTTKARTLLDLGRIAGADVVERAMESALRVHYARPGLLDEAVSEQIEALTQLRGTRNGASTLRAAWSRRRKDERPTGSFAETVALQLLRRAGLRLIERQPDLRVVTSGELIHRWNGDFLVEGRLVVEINGAVAHGGGALTARDLERNTLIGRFLNVHVASAESVLRRPRTFVDDINHALRRPAPTATGLVRTPTGFDLLI